VDQGNNGYVNPEQTNQNMNYGYNQYNPNQMPQKDNKMMIIIIVVVALIAVLAVVLFLVFGGNKTPNSNNNNHTNNNVVIDDEDNDEDEDNEYADDYEKERAKEKQEILKTISYKIEGEFAEDDRTSIVLSLDSSNNKFVNVSYTIKFYDADNVEVDSGNFDFDCVEAGNKLYDIYTASEKYATYKIVEELTEARYEGDYSGCINYKDKITNKIEVDTEEKDYNALTITNNTSSIVDVYGYILYYKDNKIVGKGYASLDAIAVGGSSRKKVMMPYDFNTHKNVDYDNTEFVLNGIYVVK
jgi:flagellar basal body-associated protein FliL